MAEPSIEREAIALFEALLAVPEDARDAWLDEHMRDRPALRARVDAMRSADRAASLRTGGAIEAAADDVPPPDRLGGYRLLDRIGRGGMGSVFRAERDLGDFAHVAAIKIIKPGLLSEALVDRFRRERQTLAQLSHPNIARLFGGGETDDGAPYIIMELVDGLALPAWMERATPSLSRRLALFEEACAAVAFAHANLIAHRDITPSNILVSHDGHAKLIDFGIARALDEDHAPDLGSAGSLTSLALTPGFSAPERHVGDGASTLADVYSLGRVLERLIRPDEMSPELRAIIAKATAQDPADRYLTVEALADDISAYRTDQPVAAFSNGARYVAGKFIARHRLAVWSASLGILMLIASLAVAIGLYVRAENARRAEVVRFNQLRDLARFMVFDLDGRLQRVVGNADARLALVDRAQHYLAALADTPNAPADLRLEAARGLVTLAKVQGVPSQPNLGREPVARANLDRALTILQAPDMGTTALPVMVDALASQAMLKSHSDADIGGARLALAQADKMIAAVPASQRRLPWLTARSQLRNAQLDVALLDQKPDDMLRLADRTERELAEWPADRQTSAEAELVRASADYYRGLHGYFTDNLAPGVETLDRAERRLTALDRRRPNDPKTLYLLAWVQYTGYGTALGIDAPRASRFLDDADMTIRRLIAIEPHDNALISFKGNITGAKAQLYSQQGRFPEAIAAQQLTIDQYEAVFAAKHAPAVRNRVAVAYLVMGNIHRQAGDRQAACANYAAADKIITALRQRKELLGFVSRLGNGVTSNTKLCEQNASVNRLKSVE